ncbi:MAG: hypothetical protein ACYDA6_00030 [Solirubrobacteraceae bacterium]
MSRYRLSAAAAAENERALDWMISMLTRLKATGVEGCLHSYEAARSYSLSDGTTMVSVRCEVFLPPGFEPGIPA